MLARGDYHGDEEDFDGDDGDHGEDESDAGDDDHYWSKFKIFNLRFQLVDLPSQRFTKDCASGRVWGEGDDVIIMSVRTVWDECEIT